MADINSGAAQRPPARRADPGGQAGEPSPLTVADHERLITLVELMFFAYRDFTGEPDEILAEFGLGRAHHRVLHFVNRRPAIRVADLLDILKITKQSLGRVLKPLIDMGYIDSQAGEIDRRERRLQLTPKGAELAERLARLQTARIAHALSAAGAGAESSTRRFLAGMISENERAPIERLILEPAKSRPGGGGR